MSNKSKRKRGKKRAKVEKNIKRHQKQIRQTKRSITQLESDEKILELMHERLFEGDELSVKEEAENLAISIWAYYKIKEKDLKKKFLNYDMYDVILTLNKDYRQRDQICNFIDGNRVRSIFGPKISSICREALIDIWKATFNPRDGEHPILKTFDAGDGLYTTVQYPDDWDSRHKNHCFVSRCIGGLTYQTVEGRIIAENCRWYHDGPKTIEINNHQYEALKRADLKVDSDMLKTPYPVFRLKLPTSVMKRAKSELGEFGLFDYVICAYEDYIFKMYMPGEKDSIYVFDSFKKNVSLEEVIMTDVERFSKTSEAGSPISNNKLVSSFTRDILRVVLNLSLLMTNGYTKHVVRKKKLKSDSPYPRECDIEEIVSFERTVCTIGRISQSEGHDGVPVDGNAKRPHWRKAHWRQQRCGPGGMDRKIIFINEVFVRSDLFSGDISDTDTSYRKAGTDL